MACRFPRSSVLTWQAGLDCCASLDPCSMASVRARPRTQRGLPFFIGPAKFRCDLQECKESRATMQRRPAGSWLPALPSLLTTPDCIPAPVFPPLSPPVPPFRNAAHEQIWKNAQKFNHDGSPLWIAAEHFKQQLDRLYKVCIKHIAVGPLMVTSSFFKRSRVCSRTRSPPFHKYATFFQSTKLRPISLDASLKSLPTCRSVC